LQNPEYLPALKALAQLYETLRDFQQAIAAWEAIQKLRPNDAEAFHKVKNLSAHFAMSRGNFGK
jgi:hypothetical protein